MDLIEPITVTVIPVAHAAPDEPHAAWRVGRIYRCAWCDQAAPVAGALPYYTYRADGERVAAPPDEWAGLSGSDGICPAHLAAVLARRRARAIAA
jgi:hypothetical protein